MRRETRWVFGQLAAVAVLAVSTAWAAAIMARSLVVGALPTIYRTLDATAGVF